MGALRALRLSMSLAEILILRYCTWNMSTLRKCESSESHIFKVINKWWYIITHTGDLEPHTPTRGQSREPGNRRVNGPSTRGPRPCNWGNDRLFTNSAWKTGRPQAKLGPYLTHPHINSKSFKNLHAKLNCKTLGRKHRRKMSWPWFGRTPWTGKKSKTRQTGLYPWIRHGWTERASCPVK